ncbi:MAG: prolipoprotein diacylglyceryl transferase [Bdellovibrionaceae bacterium]|nr:prolipoprotein diacylglyceryl transferase [Pseudobdellovibrionaceae bacterium]
MSSNLPLAQDPTQIHAWVHTLDPFLIQFSETFGIRWYGLAYMFGFVIGTALMMFIAKRGRRTLQPDQIMDYLTYVVLGTMIGGRVGYAVFYDQSLLTSWDAEVHIFGTQFPVWNLLAVWEGGMASHGGIAGIMIAAVLFARKHKMSWMHLGDLTTLGGGVGIAAGRLANFINGELMGRTVHSDLPWAVKFPQDMYRWLGAERDKLPRLTEVAREFGVTPETWAQWTSQIRSNSDSRAHVQDIIEKIIHALQSGNARIAELMQPVLEARHPSQLYQGLMEGLLVLVVCFFAWRQPRKPGVIGGLFLTMYAVMRIIGEQFRMPDAHIGFQIFGLTRGQVISIGMLIVAFAFWIWTMRRPADVIAGWGPKARQLKSEDEAKDASRRS